MYTYDMKRDSSTGLQFDFSTIDQPISWRQSVVAVTKKGADRLAVQPTEATKLFWPALLRLIGMNLLMVSLGCVLVMRRSPIELTISMIVTITMVLSLRGVMRGRSNLQLARFAQVNDLLFYKRRSVDRQEMSPTLYHGHDRMYTEVLASRDDGLQLGNYQYTVGSGKHQRDYKFEVLRLRLPNRLPHLLIDSMGDSALRGNVYHRQQRLSLEGDFDQYFRVYAPQEYHRDALYLLTPDIMEVLMTNLKDYNVELVDDWLYVYGSGSFEFRTFRDVRQIVERAQALQAKLMRRAANYSDQTTEVRDSSGVRQAPTERVVAPAGQCLRSSNNWLLGVFVIGIVVLWLAVILLILLR